MTLKDEGEGSPSRLTQALLGTGGALVLLSLALPWYVYNDQGITVSVTGSSLFGVLPVLGLLVGCGVSLVLLGVALARPRAVARRDVESLMARVAYTLAALGSIAIPLLAAYLYSGQARSL